MPRFALLLAWDGTAFAGWWRQPGLRTVAGELDAACARIGEPGAAAIGSSRTDAGVHARGQLAHLDCARAWDPARLGRVLAAQLPPDLACLAVAPVADAWHAVHGVRRKTYRYRLSAAADPFIDARFAWRPPWPLPSLAALRRATAGVAGERDWSAFARRGDHRDDTSCRIISCRWSRRGHRLACDITADGFIYRLARSLVGGMLAVARGARPAEAWRAALAGAPDAAAVDCAPACGLCLERVVHSQPPDWTMIGPAPRLPG